MIFRPFLILVTSVLLTACAGSPEPEVKEVNVDNFFYDKAFPNASEVKLETEKEIYAMDDEMRAFVADSLLRVEDPHKRAKNLLHKLFDKSPKSIRYQNGANLIAADTFRQNTANCLSLTILAYTLADAANLNVRFQEVKIPEF